MNKVLHEDEKDPQNLASESHMNEINRGVRIAKRRIVTGKFFRILTWALFYGLLLTAVGMLIPKIWQLGFLQTQNHFDAWNYSWILGGLFLALLISAALTIRQLQSNLRIAAEIDQRFGLKERLSSALSLSESDQQSEAGQALVNDATRRAETIDVRDQFPFQASFKALLPLIPLAMMFALLFLPNATEKIVEAGQSPKMDRKKVALQIEQFKEKAAKKREQLTAQGLDDASADLKLLEKKFDELLDDTNDDKKQALVKLNDIKKQIQDRRKELGDRKSLKQNLNKMKDIPAGPAKQLADALADGDMQAAKEAVKELAKKLKEGKLSEPEKKQLADNLDAMAKQIEKMAEQQQQKKQDLEKQLQKALDDGDLDAAAKAQQKIDEMEQQENQIEKMQEMAKNLQDCAKCMKPRNGGQPADGEGQQQAMKQAAESLEDLAEQIEQMQQDLEEMDALEDMEKLAGQCKQCINGQPGDGQPMPGGGNGPENDSPPKWQDWAGGGGNGGGKRDRGDAETGGFKARVKGEVGSGETVVTGTADGNNITGRTAREARDLVEASMSNDADPLENQKLPKAQREHAQQYFESLRKND
jgi:hypothetical protein